MIKYTIVLVNIIALFVVRIFFTADVTVKIDAPSQVKQGEEFTVSVTINKGSIAGVGHLKQELPAGFLGGVTMVEAKGSEFKYLPEDNVVKFTWISLPADQEFTVSYKVMVNADAPSGNITLAGKFSYVLDNQKQTFMVPEVAIAVSGGEILATTTTQPESTATTTTQPETTATTTTIPETTATTTTQPETTTTTTTQTETTTTSTTTETAKTSANVYGSRTIVGSPEAGMEFTVELNVHKNGMKGFARVQETLPAGLTAMSLENKGGTFSFIDQKVKIIWDNLPADEDIKVSYRVAVADNVSGPMAIMGSFSYVENNDPQKVEIPITSITVQEKSAWVAGTNTTSVTPPETTSVTTNVVPVPDKKVSYKVQICALSKMQRGTSYFESKFGISNKVNMEFHEGWRKYIVGKYSMYQEARDYRENMRAKGIENPFVTAYNGGKRITVQEALMVSNQQWIR